MQRANRFRARALTHVISREVHGRRTLFWCWRLAEIRADVFVVPGLVITNVLVELSKKREDQLKNSQIGESHHRMRLVANEEHLNGVLTDMALNPAPLPEKLAWALGIDATRENKSSDSHIHNVQKLLLLHLCCF